MFYGKNSIKSVNEVNDNVEARDGYVGEAGAIQIMIEAEQNNYKLFEAMVACDFDELAVKHGHLNESVLESIHEASGSGFLNKVIQWLRGVWEKINGLFKSFWATLKSVVIRDNEQLVKSLKAQAAKNIKYIDKMEIKFAVQKAGFANRVKQVLTIKDTIDSLDQLSTRINSVDDGKIEDRLAEIKSDTYIDKKYADMFGKDATASDYKKVLHDSLFEEEQKQKINAILFNDAEKRLLSASSDIKAIKDIQSEVNKIFKDQISKLERMDKSIKSEKVGETDVEKQSYTNLKGEKSTTYIPSLSKRIQVVKAEVELSAKITNNFVSCMLSEYKYSVKQARRIFVGVAKYVQLKEQVELLEGYNDVIDFEVDTMFEAGAWA